MRDKRGGFINGSTSIHTSGCFMLQPCGRHNRGGPRCGPAKPDSGTDFPKSTADSAAHSQPAD
jgi:hypothetical protein